MFFKIFHVDGPLVPATQLTSLDGWLSLLKVPCLCSLAFPQLKFLPWHQKEEPSLLVWLRADLRGRGCLVSTITLLQVPWNVVVLQRLHLYPLPTCNRKPRTSLGLWKHTDAQRSLANSYSTAMVPLLDSLRHVSKSQSRGHRVSNFRFLLGVCPFKDWSTCVHHLNVPEKRLARIERFLPIYRIE